ncbi:cell surface protein [Olivibacter sp. XZL3]|uniref:cell surface protein n=1 Tax=Olivibacter sp. XZL3 TaxID=1735116 RepID=UPI001066E77D|nr:cell surface protein [Olivibacter sp. XZL3]
MLKRIAINKKTLLFGFSAIFLAQSCTKSDTAPAVPEATKYVTKLFEYQPAPGQFINQSIGSEQGAKSILGGKEGIVSLGAFGGYIILGFDHSVVNRPNKKDIAIYGNAANNFSEPGIVWVMKDENGNGIPDDTWYEIKGSEFGKAGYTRNYVVTYFNSGDASFDVTWKDNRDGEGKISKNSVHNQSYFPTWVEKESYTLSGSLLPNTNIDKTNPQFIVSAPFAYGYVDNNVNGDEIDIADAIDENGAEVDLPSIDFIKIQTGILADLGSLGELSTEITAVEDLNIP